MLIEKVIITNFKTFREQIIDLNKFSIIVGNNGVGKSTILEAIHLALTGFYRGKSIVGNVSQDLFNKDTVEEFITNLKNGNNPIPPKITIEVFFDNYPLMNGNLNSTKSSADGFTFEIAFDDRNFDAYNDLVKNKNLDTLPFEFYKCEWNTFSRKSYTNSKMINFKSAYLDTKVDRFGEACSRKLIKNYMDDASKVELNQTLRKNIGNLENLGSLEKINNKLKDCNDLKKRNITIGIVNSSQNAWETAITIKANNIPYENIGTGEQCIVNTILSFENDLFKNKGIILIEEPENHLSGMNLNILLNYIKGNVNDYQVLISTHSSFVLNKLGMKNLLLIGKDKITKIQDLDSDTEHYFEKVAGFDTLRFILCHKAILVEGASDDLIVQRAYLDEYNKLPIDNGVEIIDTSLSYARFLELAKKLKIDTVVITDNDGNLNHINDVKNKYLNFPWIRICSGDNVYSHEELNIDKNRIKNVNTLEPELLRANSIDKINSILGKNFTKDEDLLHYMITNKTECAWLIFNSKTKINYPNYIKEALKK